jgi:HAD superfamily hydrolase (TIGR01549 family)
VFFDVGETLVDETRHWGAWADYLGVPRFAFFGAMGSVIERNEHHRHVFDLVSPGLDIDRARQSTLEQGWFDGFALEDFYTDAIPCLQALKAQGYLIGISGNQPAQAETILGSLDLGVDFIASSSSWGLEKPDPRFFQKIIEVTKLSPSEIAYVGDRLDNDVLPAVQVGMKAVFIRRGPWGFIHARRPEVARADARIESLAELPGVLERWG